MHAHNTWWIPKKLNINDMKKASKYLIGNHDFSSFRASGCQASSPIKTIKKITSRKHYPLLETLAEKIFSKLFENLRIKKVLLRIEKLDVIKNTTSVGIELEKTRSNEH